MQTLFADTLTNITITGPLVRLEFGTANSVQIEGKPEVRLVPSQHLVMPIDGFVKAFGLQENVIRKLIADGVLKPQQQAPASDTIG